ncbi:MAG: GDP-mannose 4,6-dehydratase [Acidobacteria bacterium]|nr:GDP-mannose 4,6-dehydratase [Acidobacteriota bacterium]
MTQAAAAVAREKPSDEPGDGPVVVTGGAGFIGSELTRQLVEGGRDVVVVDSLVNGRRENLAGVEGPRCTLRTDDVRDEAAMAEALRGAAVVFHLACLGVRHSLHSPRENHDVNATATLTLLKLARAAGVERFVQVSTSEVYGTALRVPMGEDHPTCPLTVYGASKLAGESYARAFLATGGLPTVVVRPFNAYGPRCHHEGDSGEVIPKFLLRAMAGRPLVVFGDGTQTRDFTFVSDTAAGIAAAGFAPGAVGATINLGSGHSVSINALAQQVALMAGRSVEVVHDLPRPGDVHDLRADASRAAALLGYAPSVSMVDGLRRLRQWYEESGVPIERLLEQEVVRNWEGSARVDV